MTTSLGAATLRINVLQEPSIVFDGEAVPLRSRLQKRLLLRLACQRGGVVSRSELVEALWPARPPRTAYELLSTHATRLRAQVQPLIAADGPADSSAIPRSEAGYRLNLEVCDCDLVELAARAEALRQGGLCPANRTAARASLAALSHRDHEATEVPIWLREATEAGWADVRALCAGLIDGPTTAAVGGSTSARSDAADGPDWDALAPLLTRLAALRPYDEPVLAWQLESLVWTGRTAEALQHMERIRTQLADELGAGPSMRLAQAFALALQHSASQAAATTAPAAPTSLAQAEPELPRQPARTPAARVAVVGRPEPGPHQLPLPPPEFVGRGELLEELSARLVAPSDGPSVVMITGSPGVGKSALAAAFADQVKPSFDGGQVYLDLAGLSDDQLCSALAPTLIELGATAERGLPSLEPSDRLADLAGLLRSLGAGRRILWILDNVDPAQPLAPLLPTEPSAAVLVTGTTLHPDLIGQPTIEVAPMDDGSVETLLEQLIGTERTAAETAAVAALIDQCEGLPAAVMATARQIAIHPHRRLADTVRRHRDPDRRLAAFSAGSHGLVDSFDRAVASLDPIGRAVLIELGRRGRSEITATILGDWLGVAEDVADDVLEDLLEARLIDPISPVDPVETPAKPGAGTAPLPGASVYGCGVLIRQYARELGSRVGVDDRPATPAPLRVVT